MLKEVGKEEERGLTIVRDRYSNLNQLISDLSIKLSEVSFNVDNEFLSAYRVHMVEVQEDLKSLKLQVATAESALNDDSAVSTLEAEVTWFSDETSRLRSHSMSMRKDMNHILARIDALNEQRHFLNDQLKQVLKRSKVLEAEISDSAIQYNLKQSLSQTFIGNVDNKINNLGVHSSAIYIEDHHNGIRNEHENNDSNDYDDYSYNFSQDNQHGMPPLPVNNMNNNVNCNKSLRFNKYNSSRPQSPTKIIVRDVLISAKNLSKNKPGIETLKNDPGSQLELLLSQRSPEELILERELDMVYKEILLRKKNSKLRNISRSSRRNAQIDDNENDIENANEEENLQHHRRLGGVTGLGLDLFGEEDRIKAVLGFLQDPAVFEKVVQVLAVNYVDIGLRSSADDEIL